MFASRTLSEHLSRGIGAALAISAAALLPATTPAWLWVLAISAAALLPATTPAWLWVPAIIALGGSALVLLRGCPMCWTVGLVETLSARRGACPTCGPTTKTADRTSLGELT